MENSWQIQKRKEMKRGYSKILYNQRNKDETIVSVIKRLFGEHISSRLIRMQNRELTFRCITYNLHRMLNLIIIKWILQSRLIIIVILRINPIVYYSNRLLLSIIFEYMNLILQLCIKVAVTNFSHFFI